MTGRVVESDGRGEDNDGYGGECESDHGETQNRQLARPGETCSEPEPEQPGESEGQRATEGQQRVERPGGGHDGENGEEAGPRYQGSLAQDEARAAEDERKDQRVRDGLRGDAADGDKAIGGRGGHLERLSGCDAGNGSLHREEGEECGAGEVFGREDADFGEASEVAAGRHQCAA